MTYANEESVGQAISALENVLQSLTVKTIATDRDDFKTCTAQERICDVVSRYERDKFDFVPVLDGNSKNDIVGLVKLTEFYKEHKSDGTIQSVFEPLSERHLIGANASIVEFIKGTDNIGCKLVIAGTKVSGLVSYSDLQRLPVRVALFAMVTHLELMMTKVIKRETNGDDDYLKHLNKTRKEGIEKLRSKVLQDGDFVDTLLLTQFCDKRDIIMKIAEHSASWNNREFCSDMKKIEKFRNNLAHANEYARTHAESIELCFTVSAMDKWIYELSRFKP